LIWCLISSAAIEGSDVTVLDLKDFTNTNVCTEWADKKVVLFSVPGAFTPGCSAKHLPGYIGNLSKLKEKGVDVIAVIAFNDSWVMSAWGKANGIKGDDIVC
jgi:alkyl hydroperoxide reductase 1